MLSNIKDLNKGNYMKSKNIQPPVDSVVTVHDLGEQTLLHYQQLTIDKLNADFFDQVNVIHR